MKRLFLLCCICLVAFSVAQTSDTAQKALSASMSEKVEPLWRWNIGVIPYQILTRSTGIYAGFNCKWFSVEYRPTYTIPTRALDMGYWSTNWFHYQGINNYLFIYPTIGIKKKWKLGFVFGYKYWWFGIQDVHSGVEYQQRSLASSEMSGFCGGIELKKDLSRRNFDCSFFFNVMVTAFKVTTIYYESYYAGVANSQVHAPIVYKGDRGPLNITCGFKLGYRKSLK